MDLFRMKSLWNQKHKRVWSFFCPLCRTTRKIAHQPRPTPMHYGQLVITTLVFTVLTSHWFSWKGCVVFIPLSIVFEVIYRSRSRVALNCPHCGFDPYLYLTDIQRAREEIEGHWRRKFAEKGIPYPEKKSGTPSQPRLNTPGSVDAAHEAVAANHPGSSSNN